MFTFVIRKIKSKKWMVLSLLIGNILLLGFSAANPIYTETALQRTLTSGMNNYLTENNKSPMMYTAVTTSTSNNSAALQKIEDYLADSESLFGLSLKVCEGYYSTAAATTTTSLERADRKSAQKLGCLTDIGSHISLIEGSGCSAEPDAEGIIDGIVSEKALEACDLFVGEVLTFKEFTDENGEPVRVRISGVYGMGSTEDPYWIRTPSYYSGIIMIDENIFKRYFMSNENAYVSAIWNVIYDYSELRTEDTDRVLAAKETMDSFFTSVKRMKTSENFTSILLDFARTRKKVQTTFLVLQIPVLILLAVFVFMVSGQLMSMEEAEISVLKSRGASGRQILFIYLLQSLMITAVSTVIAVPLSLGISYVLGSSNEFLRFVHRKNLDIHMTGSAWAYLGAAAFASVCAMVVPALRYARTTIVHQKQKKRKRSARPFYDRFFLDVVILGVSFYGLYTFHNQEEYLAERVVQGESMDPLLFLSASLFILGAGLLIMRLIPLLQKAVTGIFGRKMGPALYSSYVHLIRTRKSQTFIMIFLIFTIALGIFNASAARTVNSNDERNLKYSVGADLKFQELWPSVNKGTQEEPEYVTEEPDYGKYEVFSDQIESKTKVYSSSRGEVRLSQGSLSSVKVMGINTKEFGETAELEDGLLSCHWYRYLNALASRSDAVLVSSNFRDYGYSIGDRISYGVKGQDKIYGIIYGFVDYWPSYSAVSYEETSDGIYKTVDNYLIVANLAEIQSEWGVLPYQIWVRTKGSSQFIYDFAEENNITFSMFDDYNADEVSLKNDAVLQGTNGLLTVGFIAALVICLAGFLIYWILSVRQRELEFGILRAMGMHTREIFGMLVNEQIWISGTSVAAGVLIGILTSRLFMPLIQIAYSSADTALPLKVVSDPADFVRLGIVIGLMIALCLVILTIIVRKLHAAEALKLGED